MQIVFGFGAGGPVGICKAALKQYCSEMLEVMLSSWAFQGAVGIRQVAHPAHQFLTACSVGPPCH